MSFIKSNLLDGEKILYRTKKHFIIFLFPVFWTGVALFFWLSSNLFLVKISFVVGIIAALFWINQWLLYYVSEFAVTNKRIMLREGFFYRHINETRLSAIANVAVTQSLSGQILNYGTVFIKTFGGENDPFTEISGPVSFEKKLQELLYLQSTIKS
jgi:uncharacterized membrane protein YdbT with pleckstrin-like domain